MVAPLMSRHPVSLFRLGIARAGEHARHVCGQNIRYGLMVVLGPDQAGGQQDVGAGEMLAGEVSLLLFNEQRGGIDHAGEIRAAGIHCHRRFAIDIR